MSFVERLNFWAKSLKRDVVAVYFAARDPQAPWGLRIFAGFVAAYALSPIDLIPDFIPVLGYLDDLLIVPLGLWVIIRLMPAPVLISARFKAEALLTKPHSFCAASVIVLIWLVFGFYLVIRLHQAGFIPYTWAS